MDMLSVAMRFDSCEIVAWVENLGRRKKHWEERSGWKRKSQRMRRDLWLALGCHDVNVWVSSA
jgi:hypothetical protein